MKRYPAFALFIIACCFLLSGVATAANVHYSQTANPYVLDESLLSSVTATGTGTAVDLQVPMPTHTVTLKWSGTVPTSAVIALEGCNDGSSYVAIGTVTMDSSPYVFHVVNKLVKFLRGNFVSKVGGDATTSITMKVTSSGD